MLICTLWLKSSLHVRGSLRHSVSKADLTFQCTWKSMKSTYDQVARWRTHTFKFGCRWTIPLPFWSFRNISVIFPVTPCMWNIVAVLIGHSNTCLFICVYIVPAIAVALREKPRNLDEINQTIHQNTHQINQVYELAWPGRGSSLTQKIVSMTRKLVGPPRTQTPR